MSYSRRTFLKYIAVGAVGAALRLKIAPAQAAAPFAVYLTFDDGPTTTPVLRGPTKDVLDILKEADAKATFFLHGMAINDWEGPILARMVNEGHAIGNHLWRQGGNTSTDGTAWALLAQQYIVTERRIRAVLGNADPAALKKYLGQPRLFRRPGGNNGLTGFLDPKNYAMLETAPFLRSYLPDLPMLKGVYDYSGWHIISGDSVPPALFPADAEALTKWVLDGRGAYQGVRDYLCTGQPPRRGREAAEGLIILMHDAAKITVEALPNVIESVRALGGVFRPLPRPNDTPNAATVGIGYAPTPDPDGMACPVASAG
jgi:peptidoglycan/xylan/chitin deacetylase (PgdA/CDA1 family)